MSFEVILGEMSILTFLAFSANPWVLLPAFLLIFASVVPVHRFKPVAILLVLVSIPIFLRTYPVSPYEGAGLFISFLIPAEYIWRGKGPWKDWIHLSALILMANSTVLMEGPLSFLLQILFLAISLIRLYSDLYPGGKKLWGFLMLHLLSALILAPLVFILVPRKGLVNFGFTKGAVSGPSSTVDLNFSGEIYRSMKVVMEIEGREIPDYWVSRVYYTYYKGRWITDLKGKASTGNERLYLKPEGLLKVRINLGNSLMLPLPSGGWSVIINAPGYWTFKHFFEFSSPRSIYYVFKTPGKILFLRPHGNYYIILGRENPNLYRPTRIYLPERLAKRIRSLAYLLKGESLEDTLQNVKNYLRKNYHYSLKIKRKGQDPLEGFLFYTKTGHCELFASAAAALLYAMGEEIRLVSGFRISERGEGWAIARMKDAHTWVQIWKDGKWIDFDPSPPSSPHREIFPWQRFTGKVQVLWDKYITGFSYLVQIKIFQWIKRNATLMVSILLFILAVFFLFRRKMLSETVENSGKEKEILKAPWYYKKMLKISPFKKLPWQTPMEFSRLLGEEGKLIARYYYKERFGKISLEREELNEIKEALRKIENRFRRSKRQD